MSIWNKCTLAAHLGNGREAAARAEFQGFVTFVLFQKYFIKIKRDTSDLWLKRIEKSLKRIVLVNLVCIFIIKVGFEIEQK